MPPRSRVRRNLLRAAAATLFLPEPFALVWAQSDGALKLLRLPKRALVIGNGAYRRVAALRNTRNDASAIAEVLRESGFAVTTVLESDRAAMLAAVDEYVRAVTAQKCVGLFYFAGHGLQLAWRNYLLPVDAEIDKPQDIASQSVDVGTLVAGIRGAANPMNVIILDACRENPFNVEQKGLSQMDAPPGTLLAYATAPGNFASDGAGQNGLYTGHLLREMRVREAKIEDVFKRVRLGVRLASKGAQIPWESTSLEEDFYFIPPESLRKLSEAEEERLFAEERRAFEGAVGAGEVGLAEYLRNYPSGRFAELAQVYLDRALAAAGERRVEVAPSAGNPNTSGSARADTQFKVGDTYVYNRTDRLRNETRQGRQKVTAVTDREVIFNDGKLILDLLGNQILSGEGQRFSQRQDLPLEYAVGKRWTTRYEVLGGGQGSLQFDYRITARERITVPAGTFDCFRIEGQGSKERVFHSTVETSRIVWRAPDQVRQPIALENLRRSQPGGRIMVSERRELVSFRQS